MRKSKKLITFDERKAIQLEMLKEIHAFCVTNGIRYSLAFGTLLGAVRHKGFIPWDDDVDIMMPLSDMIRFKELFHSESLKYCDIDTNRDFRYAFARITNLKTYNRIGRIYKSYGICIDLYPVVSIPENQKEQLLYFERAARLEKWSDFLAKWRLRAIRYLSIRSIPFYRKSIRLFTEHLRYSCKYCDGAESYYIIAGPISLHSKMSYSFDMFQDFIDVQFEGVSFKAIAKYDLFLTLRYGDYMVPPPEEERHPYHGGSFFWK